MERKTGLKNNALLKLMIADDHPMVLEGLEKMLNAVPGFSVMETFLDGRSVLDALKSVHPDVLLLDVQLSDFTAEELVPLILKAAPQLPILIVSSVDQPTRVRQIMRLGCRGYVLKNTGAEELAKAVSRVACGELYMNAALQEQLMHDMLLFKSGQPAGSIRLTRREKEILQLVGRSMTSRQIAEALSISIHTVENHRKHLFQKFDVPNVAGLIRKALHMGYIDTKPR